MSDQELTNTIASKQVFAEQLQANFVMQHATGTDTLTLVEVSSVSAEKTEQGQNEPFSAVFQSASPVIHEQGIYQLQQAHLGELQVFLVPINADENSVQYEAIFT